MSIRKSNGGFAAVAGLSAAMAMFGLLPPAFAVSTPQSERLFARAQELEKSGDLAGAIIELKNALRMDPDYTQGRYDLGMLYLRTNDLASAQAELEAARARGYDEAKIVPPLLQTYIAQGRFREILRNFDAAKFSGDAQSELIATQARARAAFQELDTARALVDRAIAQSPKSAVVLSAAAAIARVQQRYAEAEKFVDQGLAVAPADGELLVMKAEARQQAKDFDGAIKALDLAVEKQPGFMRARLARAMVNLARGKPELMAADVSVAQIGEPNNPMTIYLRAVLFAAEGRHREAVQTLRVAPALLNAYPPARYMLALSSFGDNQFESARANAELFLKKLPGDPAGSSLLAAASLRRNDPKRAVEVLEPLVGVDAKDNQMRLQLAHAYLGVGRGEEAIKLFEQTARAAPENEQAQMALALGQLQTGSADAGATQLQKMIEAKPDTLQVNQLLIMTQIQAKQFDKARQTADAFIKATPKSPQAHALRGTVNMAADDLPAARAAFNTALENDAKYTPAMLNLARIEERSKQPAAARAWYQRAIAADAANQTAYVGLSNLALAENNLEGAFRALEQAVAAAKADAGPRLRLVNLFLDAKQTGRALVAARELANMLPDDPRAIDALGRTQLANGDAMNAIGTFRRLVTLARGTPEPKRRLGRVLMNAAAILKKASGGQASPDSNRYVQEAKESFDSAIADAPDNTAILTDRLAAEQETAGAPAALTLALKFVQERPESAPRMVVAGDLATAQGNHPVAVVNYRGAMDKTPNGVIVRRLYYAMVNDKKANAALALVKKWAAENPTDYETRFLITSVAINEGKLAEAITETEALVAAQPGNPIVLNNLAWLYGQTNNPRAFDIGQQALDIVPDSPLVLDNLGWLEVEKRDLKRGLALLEKAHANDKANPLFAYHYAVALNRNGDKAKAKTVLEEVLKAKRAFSARAQAEALLKELGG